MRLLRFLSKINKHNVLFIIAGILVGALSLVWGGKILSSWFNPVMKNVCLTYTDMTSHLEGAERVIDVEAVRVTTGTMTKRINTIGKLRANEDVMLRSEMAGRITDISFKEGEAVEKGEVLIRFEDADVDAEVTLAEAELTLRQADYGRISKLRSQNIESAKRFDEVKAGLITAEAKLQKAKAQLERTQVIAPFSGNIGLIDVSVGTYVQTGQDLVRLVDNSPIKIDFRVPEQNVHDVGVGQIAEMTLDGFPNEIFIATVASVDVSLDTGSHSLSLRATSPNEDGRLRAGMFAGMSLIVGEKGNTIVVPESAVTRDGEREFVWVIQNGRSGRRRVMTGAREKGQVEIIQGLRLNDLVVTAGQIKLGEGASVNATNLESLEDFLQGQKEPSPDESIKEVTKQEELASSLEAQKESLLTINPPKEEKDIKNLTGEALSPLEQSQENQGKISKILSGLKNMFSKNKE